MLDSNYSGSTIEELQKEIAELRRQVDEYRRLASIPQMTSTPVFEFTQDGQAVFINPAGSQILSELGISDASQFLPDNYRSLIRDLNERGERQCFREVKVDGHTFGEDICFSEGYAAVRIYATDITHHLQVEEELKVNKLKMVQAKEFLEEIANRTDILIATIDKDYVFTYFNQAYKEEVKCNSGTEIQIGMNLLEAFAHLPEQQKVVEQQWKDVLQGEYTNRVVEFGNPSQYQGIYNVIHAPILDASGNVVGAGVVAFNISEQIHARAALNESEARFRMVLKNVPISVAAQDKDLKFVWAYNQRTVDPSDVIGKTDSDLFPPETAAWTTGLKHKVLETGKEVHEQGWVTSGGQRLFLDIFLEPIRNKDGQITGVGVATVDLTPIKLTEQALKASEERYRMLFDAMTEGFAIQEMIFDSDGKPCDYRFLDINPAFERLTGLQRDHVIGKTYHELFPNEGDSWVKIYGDVVLTGKPARFENYSPTLNKYYEVFADRSAPGQFAVVFMDFTERRQMEDKLRINLAKYSVLFDSFPLGVTVSDKNGKIIESNREAIRLLDLSEEEHYSRKIDGSEWKIIRPDGTPMPADEFASVRALKEQRRIENVEMGIVKDKHQVSWISVTAAPLPLEDFGVVITYEDITARINAEEKLRQANEELEETVQKRTEELVLQTRAVDAQRQRFNAVLEILPAYLILLTPDYHVAFANRYFRERFGEDRGRCCYEYLFGISEPCENCETYKVLDTSSNHHWEWTGPDGHNYDVFDFPFTDADGSSLILEMGIDITGRKQAEEKLRLLNTYNRSLIEANLDALVTITPEGKIGDVNTVTEAITGYPRDELIGTDFHNYFTDPEKARKGYEKVFETGLVRNYELEIQHKDGHITPVVYNASVYRDETGQVAGVFAAAHDITERKKAERQLIVLNTALEAAANGIILTDKDGTFVWSNSSFCKMTGYRNDEIVGKNPRILKSGIQDREFYRNMWETILSGKVWRGELVNRRKNGNLYYEEQTITPVIDQKDVVTNFISIRQDITDHKRAEDALKKREEQYRSLVLATTQIIWQTDAQGNVVEDIPTWRAFSGQSEEEIQGNGWINSVHPEDRSRVAEVWSQAVENRTPYNTEYRIKKHTGEYGYFSVRGVPISDSNGNISGWVGTATDITEKKNYEDQLLQAEKHAAIGRMVGSVTHEINNPLQTIKNCLYLIHQDTKEDDPNREPLEMALSETQRLSNIVGQLRQLYRPQVAQLMRAYDLLEIIEEVHSLIETRLCNSRIDWQSLSDVQSCKIDCVKDQIIEVLLNISMNAIEAMQPDGGTLSVNVICPADKGQVGIMIKDSGPGINPDIMSHIFEPFTTTKEYGLGLGLSICYSIIQKHGGQITVDSQPDQGTTFTIWLPIIG